MLGMLVQRTGDAIRHPRHGGTVITLLSDQIWRGNGEHAVVMLKPVHRVSLETRSTSACLTMVHRAARRGFTRVVRRLADLGATINSRTRSGITGLTTAVAAESKLPGGNQGAVWLLPFQGGAARHPVIPTGITRASEPRTPAKPHQHRNVECCMRSMSWVRRRGLVCWHRAIRAVQSEL